MKPKRFGETLPVRLSKAVDDKLKRIAKHTGLSKSDVLRMAVNHGLPAVEAGKMAILNAA
jgi:predicted DNA-binding protein